MHHQVLNRSIVLHDVDQRLVVELDALQWVHFRHWAIHVLLSEPASLTVAKSFLSALARPARCLALMLGDSNGYLVAQMLEIR